MIKTTCKMHLKSWEMKVHLMNQFRRIFLQRFVFLSPPNWRARHKLHHHSDAMQTLIYCNREPQLQIASCKLLNFNTFSRKFNLNLWSDRISKTKIVLLKTDNRNVSSSASGRVRSVKIIIGFKLCLSGGATAQVI